MDHEIEKAYCVESAKMDMALHCNHTLWNAVSAGDMVMDGSYTISWTVIHFLVVIFHIRAISPSTKCSCVHESDGSVYNVPLNMYIENI